MFGIFQKKKNDAPKEEKKELETQQEVNFDSGKELSGSKQSTPEAAFDDVTNIHARASDRLNAITPQRLQAIGKGALLKERDQKRLEPHDVSSPPLSKETIVETTVQKDEKDGEGKSVIIPVLKDGEAESSATVGSLHVSVGNEGGGMRRAVTPSHSGSQPSDNVSSPVLPEAVAEKDTVDQTPVEELNRTAPAAQAVQTIQAKEKEIHRIENSKKPPEPRLIVPQTSVPASAPVLGAGQSSGIPISGSDALVNTEKPKEAPKEVRIDTPTSVIREVPEDKNAPKKNETSKKDPLASNVQIVQTDQTDQTDQSGKNNDSGNVNIRDNISQPVKNPPLSTDAPHPTPIYDARQTADNERKNPLESPKPEPAETNRTKKGTNPYENEALIQSVNESFNLQSASRGTQNEIVNDSADISDKNKEGAVFPQKQTFDSPYLGQAEDGLTERNMSGKDTNSTLSNIEKISQQSNQEEERSQVRKTPKQSWVRTYRDDLKEGIKTQGSETVNKVLRAEKRRQEIKKKYRLTSPKNIATILASTALFLGTLAIIFYIVLLSVPDPKQQPAPPPLIGVDKTETIPLDQKSPEILRLALAQAARSDLSEGSILNLVPVEKYTALTLKGKKTLRRYAVPTDFFTALKSVAPLRFLQTLGNEGMFGIYAGNEGNHPFIILKTKFYESAFSGMMSWEKELVREFSLWFDLRDPDTIANIKIENVTLKNNDVRILTSVSGETLLLYSFSDQSTLVISDDQNTLLELYKRLESAD